MTEAIGHKTDATKTAAIGCKQPWINIFHITASSIIQYRFLVVSGLSKSYINIIYKCNIIVINGIHNGAATATIILQQLTKIHTSGNIKRIKIVPRKPFTK